MFTGIIEELGTIQELNIGNDSARITINAATVMEDTQIGDSIAVNGVCLTVTHLDNAFFTVDVMPETIQKTNLKELHKNDKVNLERALQLKTRLGGHMVTGHVDGIGTIKALKPIDIANLYEISAPAELTKTLIPKGSIAIDGISLTIVDVKDGFFSVSLIPHTFTSTTLGFKKTGSHVNLETDIIGKYVAKYLGLNKTEKDTASNISMDFLAQHGFI